MLTDPDREPTAVKPWPRLAEKSTVDILFSGANLLERDGLVRLVVIMKKIPARIPPMTGLNI